MRIVIIGCGKSKKSTAMTAENIYTSTLFSLSRKYAQLNSDRWFIVSAKHGLIAPDTVIEPYEQLLTGSLAPIAAKIQKQIRDCDSFPIAESIQVIAGRKYVDALRLTSVSEKICCPVEGMPLFRRMAWLSKENKIVGAV